MNNGMFKDGDATFALWLVLNQLTDDTHLFERVVTKLTGEFFMEAEVIRCEVAIVGGGIAGAAIAERLAREASRQNKQVRIVLIEQEDELGTGSSGRLEGWYHTGALYSAMVGNTRFLEHFIESLENMYNWYHLDTAFLFRENCNLTDLSEENPRPKYDFSCDSRAQWFVKEINYLYPGVVAEDENSSDARLAGMAWQRASAQAKALVAQIFYKYDWRNPDFHSCQAPHLGTDAKIPGGSIGEVNFRDILNAYLDQDQNALDAALEELNRREEELREILDHKEGATLDLMPSRDVVMNTWQILHDLVKAAAEHGVQFLTGYKLEPGATFVSRVTGRVEGLIARKSDGTLVHIIADQYVFAIGSGFEEKDFLRKHLGVRVRVEKKRSIMVVASHRFSKHSFVWMDPDPRCHFNNIYQPGYNEGLVSYSIVADSNAEREDAGIEECAAKASRLIEKAEKFFKDGKVLGWYSCDKTEFISREDTPRDYSYQLVPRLQSELVNVAWSNAKNNRQKQMEERIKQHVIRGKIKAPIDLGEQKGQPTMRGTIDQDGWALGKALHFALQKCNSFDGEDCENHDGKEVGYLGEIQNLIIETYNQLFEAKQAMKPNFVCIVPGKFSLFPTLAHQVYIEMEGRGLFKDAPELFDSPQRHPPPDIALGKAEEIISRLKASPDEEWRRFLNYRFTTLL